MNEEGAVVQDMMLRELPSYDFCFYIQSPRKLEGEAKKTQNLKSSGMMFLIAPRNSRWACVLHGVKESKEAPAESRCAESALGALRGCAPKTRPRTIFPGVARVS